MKIKSIVIALLTLLVFFPALAGAAPVGKLTSVEGRVDITSPGKAAKPVKIGDTVSVGDIIRTKSNSKCEVTFGDGNILRLAESTRLKVTTYMFDKGPRNEVLNLFRGKIQNIVQKVAGIVSPEKAGRYEIHTPTAVVGVRGTNFFSWHQSGITGALFKEGLGYGYSNNRPQDIRTINPGQAMVVTNPNVPPTVRPATTQEMEQHQKETAPEEKKAQADDDKKDGDDKKTDAVAAKTDDGNGKKDDQDKKSEGSQPLTLADVATAPVSIPTAPLPIVLDPLPTDVTVVFTPPDTAPPDTPLNPSKIQAYIHAAGAFTHSIDNGLFTGTIDDTTGAITTTVGGAMTDASAPVDAAGGHLGQGTITNGTSFAGYFMGLPAAAGKAQALVRNIYVTDTGEAGFLYGPLDGIIFQGDAFGGAGTAVQKSMGTTSLARAAIEGAMDNSGWTFAQPHMGNITVGGSSLSISAGNAEGEGRGITLTNGKKIGVWGVVTNGGTYQNLSNASTIAGDFGDSGTFLSGNAYHMVGDVQGYDTAEGLVSLFGKFNYLDRDNGGTIKADYIGYNAGGAGGFRSIMAGDIALDPLVWSANIDYDYNGGGLYSVDGAGIQAMGDVHGGLAGSRSAPWSGKTYFSHMGAYSPVGGRGSYLWTAPLYSYNYKIAGGVNETYDGGAFFGLIGGVWQDDGGIDSRVYATYVSPAGKAGILKGWVGGAYYPDVSMYQTSDVGKGDWTAVELGAGSVADVAAISVTPHNDMNDTVGISTLAGSFGGSGNIASATSGSKYQAVTYSASGQKWGIFQTVIGGAYTGTPSDTWYLGTDYHNTGDTLVTGTETIGNKWSETIINNRSVKKILGETRGFAADISGTPGTWIGVGETVGSFNPSITAWQAVQTAAYLDTNLFLTLASTDAGRAKLQQLNIPAVEVGKATLAGSYTGMGNLSVTMNNVTFFANSTGGPPRLWATNGVTGSYDSAYGYVGTTVPLSGNGLTANFNVKTWDAVGGKWLSTVANGNGTYSGTGSMNGSPVGFRGAAAGTINTTAHTIFGTAAGTAK